MKRIIKGSWLTEYLKYVKKQESPVLFHTWVAFSQVASALGRNVFYDYGYFNVYPNLYIILVAESAKDRKSTALRIGTGILDLIDNAPPILAEKITPEAIVQQLESSGMTKDERGELQDCECVISAEELSVFLGEDAFGSGTAALLTRFFDCPDKWKKATKGEGVEYLHDVVVNLIGATTPDWLRRCIPHDAVGGGFISRFIFVNALKGGILVPRPKLTPELMQIKSNLIHDLSGIRQLNGEFKMDEDAGEHFDKWYYNWMKKIKDAAGYEPKKHVFVLKLAMIISACRADKLEIKLEDIKAALKHLSELEVKMKDVSEAIWMSPVGELCERTLYIIREAGPEGIQRSWLMRRIWRFADAETLDRIVVTLSDSRLIKVEKMLRGKVAYGFKYTAR